MNDKSNPDGSPKVVYLQDVLDKELGNDKTRVILPITDPYVAHHGSLGSLAMVFFREQMSPGAVTDVLSKLWGVELALDRESAVKRFDLPSDRIGDIIAVGDKGTVLGTKKESHDLSQLGGMRLRSHGGLADSNVSFILSRKLNSNYEGIAKSRQLRNYDIFDFALNGVK